MQLMLLGFVLALSVSVVADAIAMSEVLFGGTRPTTGERFTFVYMY